MSNLTKATLLSWLLGLLLVVGVAIAPAHAQATRTWISGVGDDANPCSRAAPCKTFAGAISKTAAGGEIDNVDTGGYGALTITKAITLDGGGGTVASILVTGQPGITIAAGSTDVVILRNLQFNGILQSVSAGTTGVNITSAGKVVIEKCEIFGFSGQGIQVGVRSGTFQFKVQETTINNNGGGIQIQPSGGAVVTGAIERTHVDGNGGPGVRVDGTLGGSSAVAISDSSVSLNTGNGFNVLSGPSGNVKVDLTRVIVANNGGDGVRASNSSGGTALITVGQSMLSNNVAAWSQAGSPQLLSFQNNQVTGPVGAAPSPISPQ